MNQFNRVGRRNRLAMGVTSAIALTMAISAQADTARIDLDIKSQKAGPALVKLGEESSVQIIFSGQVAKTVDLDGISGSYTVSEALTKMLDGSGLAFEFTSENTIVIKEEDGPAEASDDEKVDEEVVVTGSRLRVNPNELSGNRVSLDREYIENSGEVTLPDLLRKLPQSSGNTTNVFGSTLNGTTNFSGATAINLRGVGANNTLILVDGRRRGQSGLAGAVSDISSIPLSSVERVEVLLEGASAIYGSDAVGGVINIITRKDYESVEVSLDYSRPAVGGTNTGIFSVSGGFSWDTGRARAGFEYQKEKALGAAIIEVVTIQNGMSALGDALFDSGPDLNFTSPNDPATAIFYNGPGGNITVDAFGMLIDPTGYIPVTEFTAPDGWDGMDLNAITMFEATQRTQADRGRNRTLIPESERRSISLGVEQELSDTITLNVDVSYADREVSIGQGNATFASQTFAAGNINNPFDVDVNLNGWFPGSELPQTADTDGTDLNVNFKLDGQFGDSSWNWETTAGYTKNKLDTTRTNVPDLTGVGNALGSDGSPQVTFTDELTAAECSLIPGSQFGNGFCVFAAVIDPLNPYGDLSSFISPTDMSTTDNTSKRFEAIVRGTLMELPGGEVQVSAGASWREENIFSITPFPFGASRDGFTSPPTVLRSPVDADISQAQKALFVEGFVPLVSDANSLPGINSLSMNFSARYDDYDEVDVIRAGVSVDPCEGELGGCDTSASDTSYGLGFVYTPVDDALRFRVNWSSAFVAPQLNQLYQTPTEGFTAFFLQVPVGDPCPAGFSFAGPGFCRSLAVAVRGGNPTLDPETSDTLSVGIDYEPEWLPGLVAKVTWSSLKTVDRITPVGGLTVSDLDNLPAHISLVDGDYVADFRPINVAQLDREGMDYELRYNLDTSVGTFDFQTLYSRTLKFEYTPTPGDDPANLLGTAEGFTAIAAVPKYAASAQLGWALGGMRASINYSKSGTVSNALSPNFVTFAQAPTLFNLSLNYDLDSGTLFEAPAWLEGAEVTFRVNNLTNDFSRAETQENGVLASSRIDEGRAYLRGRTFGINFRKTFD